MSSRRLEASLSGVKWTLLPLVLWDEIISYVDNDDRANLRLTCMAFHDAVEACQIWHKAVVCLKNVGVFRRSTWEKLKRRKITAIFVERCTSVKDIQEILTNLPTVHTIHSKGVDNVASLLQRAPVELLDIQHFLVVNPYNCNTASGKLLSHMYKMHNLRTLNLRFFSNEVIETHVNFLLKLPKLETFELHLRHPLTNSSILQRVFHELPHLKNVYLHGVHDDMSQIFLPYHKTISGNF